MTRGDVKQILFSTCLTLSRRRPRKFAPGGDRRLLFLDEPTVGFDPEARRGFHDVVHRLADREQTTILPVFLQWAGQVFPMYWLGLGMRSALLPNAMAAVEIGHSWRHLATFGALSVWAVAGFVLAPVVLRRMARRETGSRVAARREKAIRGS